MAQRKRSRLAEKIMIGFIVVCAASAIVGGIVASCGSVGGPSRYDRPEPTAVTGSPVDTVPDFDPVEVYLGHLASRGIVGSDRPHDGAAWSDMTDGSLVNIGHAVCQGMENGVEWDASIAMVTRSTGNALVSALIVDAATTHLCVGIDR